MVSIETYESKYKSQWDSFIDVSKNATFLFKRDFMDYHSSRFQDSSFLIFKDLKLVALFPANIEAKNLYSHKGLTYGGLVVKENIKFNHFLDIFKSLLEFCYNNSFKKLFIKEIPSIYNSNFSYELDYLSFITNGNIYRKDIISVIELNKRIKISKDRVQGYKRGVKNNLKIVETNNFREFWNKILKPNLSKKHSIFPVHSIYEIERLKSSFGKNIRQFNVYHMDNLVAGTTIFQTKNVIHVQYTGSNKDKNILGSLDFLFYNLIIDTFSDYKFFDFGNSNEKEGKKVNSGLLYWKEGFGARSISQNFYEINTADFEKLNNLMI